MVEHINKKRSLKQIVVGTENGVITCIPVIRCKDCDFYNTSCYQLGDGWCEEMGNTVYDGFYCAHAEPKARDEE